MSRALNVASFRWDDTHCAALLTLKSYLRSILIHKPARDVRFGSISDIPARSADVCFASDSGLNADVTQCPFRATSRHQLKLPQPPSPKRGARLRSQTR